MKFTFTFFAVFIFISQLFSQIPDKELILWLKADSVTLENDKVAIWYDKSQNYFHAVQTNQNDRPTQVVNAYNNLPVVRFNGLNNYLITSFGVDMVQPNTYFVVWSINGLTGGVQIPYTGLNTGKANATFWSNLNRIVVNGGIYINNVYSKLAPFSFMINTTEFNGVATKIYENGLLKGVVNAGTNPVDGLSIGGVLDFKYWLKGDIAELIMYNRLLSTTEREEVEQYLINKYAPPISLGDDIYVDYGFCPITLDIGNAYSNILWSTGDTISSIQINQTGTYWVEAIGLGRHSSDTVYVEFPPIYLADTVICYGDTAFYDPLPGQAYSFVWSDGTTQSKNFFTEAGNYWIEITDTALCPSVFNFKVDIDSFPIVASLGADTALCVGDELMLLSGVDEAIAYQWSDGTNLSSMTVKQAGEYSLTVSNHRNCVAKDSIIVSIKGSRPKVEFLADTACFGHFTSFFDISTPVNPDSIISRTWVFNQTDTLFGSTASYQFPTHGEQDVLLILETANGCIASKEQQAFVIPNPKPNFLPYMGCSKQNIQFQNQSSSDYPGNMQYQWKVFSPQDELLYTSNLTQPQFQFDTAGTYKVFLSATLLETCTDSVKKVVEIRNNPPITFSYSNVCAGQTTTFTDLTQVPSHEVIIERKWFFGDGNTSNLPNPTHQYANAGIYNVSLFNRSINGCADTLTKEVQIHAQALSDFHYSNNCVFQEVQFSDNTVLDNDTISNYLWTFDNLHTSASPNPIYVFADTGTYQVKLDIQTLNGCVSSIQKNVPIHSNPSASFSFYPEYGNPPLQVEFANTSIDAYSYLWNFGDGNTSTLPNPTHVYTESDIFNVSLTVANQFLCSDSAFGTIYVVPSSYDIYVKNVEIIKIDDNFFSVHALIQNLGNRIVKKLQLHFQIDNQTRISEIWEGAMQSGEEYVYVFNSLIHKRHLEDCKILCVNVYSDEDIEDFNPQNNIYCFVNDDSFEIVSVRPNPVSLSAELLLVLEQNSKCNIIVSSIEGNIVFRQDNVEAKRGLNIFTLDVSHLNEGVYLISVQSATSEAVKRIVVLR